MSTSPFSFVQAEAPVDPQHVLDDAVAILNRFCALPNADSADAIVLWCAATHALPSLPSAPRLTVTSPVKRSGKSRTLEIVHALSHAPLKTANASTAAIFRSLEAEHPPTLIFDEVDTIFGSRMVAEKNEELRGLLNAGFQRGWPTLRCVGPQQEPTEFPTYAMAALAGIGGLPDTITDRAVNIRMRRRKSTETVQPFRERRDRPALDEVRDALAGWLADDAVLKTLENSVPEMELEDRAADVWEPLVMIADTAGGTWPARARAAAARLTRDVEHDEQEESVGVQLLSDLKAIFEHRVRGDWLATVDLLQHLRQVDDGPWREMDRLTGHWLGRELRAFSVRSTRNAERSARGYRRADLVDAFERYLPPGGDER